MAAGIAVPRRTFAHLVELALAVAFWTIGARSVLGVAIAPQPLKARGVVRELADELHERVGRFRRVSAERVVAVNGRHLRGSFRAFWPSAAAIDRARSAGYRRSLPAVGA